MLESNWKWDVSIYCNKNQSLITSNSVQFWPEINCSMVFISWLMNSIVLESFDFHFYSCETFSKLCPLVYVISVTMSFWAQKFHWINISWDTIVSKWCLQESAMFSAWEGKAVRHCYAENKVRMQHCHLSPLAEVISKRPTDQYILDCSWNFQWNIIKSEFTDSLWHIQVMWNLWSVTWSCYYANLSLASRIISITSLWC